MRGCRRNRCDCAASPCGPPFFPLLVYPLHAIFTAFMANCTAINGFEPPHSAYRARPLKYTAHCISVFRTRHCHSLAVDSPETPSFHCFLFGPQHSRYICDSVAQATGTWLPIHRLYHRQHQLLDNPIWSRWLAILVINADVPMLLLLQVAGESFLTLGAAPTRALDFATLRPELKSSHLALPRTWGPLGYIRSRLCM